MIPKHLYTLLWDTNPETFDPGAHSVYTINRVLEHGDEAAVSWLLGEFTIERIRDALRTDASLSPRSADFWALVFDVPGSEVAALDHADDALAAGRRAADVPRRMRLL